MLGTIVNIFTIPDLRKKLLFTFMLLFVVYRIGFHIPIPGFDQEAIYARAGQGDNGGLGRVLDQLQMLSGGNLQRASLFGMGIMPYITASIILMLLGEVIPSLQKLRQEGATGHKKIQEYTRYLTVGVCIIQAMAYMKIFGGQAYAGMQTQAMMFGVIGMTAGTVFLMWVGEQIDEYGIGNGISLIIMAGIVSQMPMAIRHVAVNATFSIGDTEKPYGPEKILFLIGAFVFVVAGAILITQAQRRIPVQQAKQMRGRRMYGGQRHYLPLRVNHGGVMPIIFASSLMMFPPMLTSAMRNMWPASTIVANIDEAFAYTSFTYNLIYVIMIFLFAYFWTTIQFQPKEMAKRLRDSGSFIPGLRPGHRTAEYLETVMTRITYYGAAFLAFIAVVPSLMALYMEVPWEVTQFLGGTGLLIVVSVSLDLVQRIEANLIMRNYEGFSESGRIKGAYA
ncbi:MAG TPA: preprotein translocase subunit SecY [Sedimentisphaerales bacterium]|nr:preprotein translocase subunit SecY [Sedimentisphaerales bacterium]